MKTIGVVAVNFSSYKRFLDELGIIGEEINKFTFINKIDHIYGKEFITVIRADFLRLDWDLHELFMIAKQRIK